MRLSVFAKSPLASLRVLIESLSPRVPGAYAMFAQTHGHAVIIHRNLYLTLANTVKQMSNFVVRVGEEAIVAG